MTHPAAAAENRITSVDALRGLVMFAMIFVNDLAGAPSQLVPAWLRHFPAEGNGMTFVDLVFPAFLFIVGLSIPLALGSRIRRGEALWRTLVHVITRTLSLLAIGILMVNGSPDPDQLGGSGSLWSVLMFLAVFLAFASWTPKSQPPSASRNDAVRRNTLLVLRLFGTTGLVLLALSYRGHDGHRILALSPFSIHTSWYGILGLIGWAYLVAAVVYLLCRTNRTALLASVVILFCLYPADQCGAFAGLWISRYVNLGSTLGSQAAIAVSGVLLASYFTQPEATPPLRSIACSTLAFASGYVAAAWLLHGLYGINKNHATPSWCLWACALTAVLWLLLHYGCEFPPSQLATRILALGGTNVLLAYLFSEMLPSVLQLLHLSAAYGSLATHHLAGAVARSGACALLILIAATLLNRLGFRLKL